MIVFNPASGAPVPPFRYEGVEYKDEKNKNTVLAVGELLQFPDPVAEFMIKNWAFLKIVTPQEATEIKAKAEEKTEEIKCEKCEVTFKPGAKAALAEHIKLHENKIEETIPGIPVAQAISVEPLKSISQRQQDDLTPELGFYGPGMTETRGLS